MKLNSFTGLAGTLIAAVAFVSGNAQAQGPLYDKVIVDLPYAVTVNETTLQPGHYVIRQFNDQGGGSRVLQIFSDNGMKLDATAITIPALDNNTPEKTSVILHHYGNDYFFDKVWVQGKNYGYEFPLPASVKAREKERMEPYTVAARYESAQQTTQTAEATPAPAPTPEPAPAPAPQEQAQAAPAPAPAPAPEAAPAPAPETNQMPSTADGWALNVVLGSALVIAGLVLRRRLA